MKLGSETIFQNQIHLETYLNSDDIKHVKGYSIFVFLKCSLMDFRKSYVK